MNTNPLQIQPKMVIVGATSSIAEHCARLWLAESPKDLTLVARNLEKLKSIADDLQVRSPDSLITCKTIDFQSPEAIHSLVAELTQSGMLGVVLIAHGSLPEQLLCQDNLARCAEALNINAISPALFAEAFSQPMQRANHGTLILIGSVAGDRGRKSNYVYGAGKGLLTRYAQGLQHRLAQTQVKVVLIKPGPTDTPMTAQLKTQGARLATAQSVAQCIVDGVRKGKPIIYAPGKWALIMMVIRHLPNFIFNRIDI